MALFLTALVTGCGSSDDFQHANFGSPSSGGAGPGPAAIVVPTVTSTAPQNKAIDMPLNTKVLATFSQPMDPATITNVNFTLKGPGETPVPGTVSYQGTTATFTPTANLAADTLFTATISTGAKDTFGTTLASNFVWVFVTGKTLKKSPPTVTSTVPANGATAVSVNSRLSATFSEAMDPATLTGATFTLTGPGATPVAGLVTYAGQTATFTPTAQLAPNTRFTGTITTGAKDLAGNALANNFVWTFTTGATPDITAPMVTSTLPANNATGILTNSRLNATFNEAMDPLTVNTATFLLAGPGGTPVPGTVTYVGVTATFIPTNPLPGNTLFTAAITTGARDLAGNALASNFVWTFTTGATPDTTPPTVTSTVPAPNATGVLTNSSLNAVFSEAMDPLTVTTATFTLTGPGATPVVGTVTYVGTTATFTPMTNLAGNTLFTATITTGATDLAGNALANNFVWTFTTGAAPDVTAPTVTSVTPLNNATGVAVNTRPTANFSEAMDPLTVTTTNFTVTGPGATPVAGTVLYVGNTATFTPLNNLAGNTLFTATIKTGARDLAGNPLASDFVWSFTTGATPDTTRPTVTLTTPLNNATGVAVNIKPTANFSEAMDPLTITTTTFTLTGPGATPVAGTVNLLGNTATFTPNVALAGNTLFTATITTGATDLAGNALASNFVWTFTTGAAPDTIPPTVLSTVPLNNATGVAVNIKPSATFSEAMDPLTITTATFTLTGPGATPVVGTVNLLGNTATFTPNVALAGNTLFTGTITTGARDLAGNALASNFVWTFTTGATPDTTPPTVISTDPLNNATGVAVNARPRATFSEAMDPLTVTTATFTVTGPGATPVAGTVSLVGATATFTPTTLLPVSTLFTATITTGARDLAGNPLASDFVWTFTTAAAPLPGPVNLGAMATFGGMGGGAGMTNSGIFTVINGDIGTTGASTTMTGFHDLMGNIYTETPLNVGLVNGTINTAPPPPGTAATFALATQALADAQQAFDDLSPASLPGGTDPGAGQLGGLTLPPGIYRAAGGSFQITGSDLTLDGQGDPNAFWVFQTATTLTVGAPGAPRSVILIGGAQPKNVFWQVGSAATINGAGGGTMVGTIIASAGVTFSTAGVVTITTLEGRAIGLNASVTMVNTRINVPAP